RRPAAGVTGCVRAAAGGKVARGGFEPPQALPKSAVLPLHHRARGDDGGPQGPLRLAQTEKKNSGSGSALSTTARRPKERARGSRRANPPPVPTLRVSSRSVPPLTPDTGTLFAWLSRDPTSLRPAPGRLFTLSPPPPPSVNQPR